MSNQRRRAFDRGRPSFVRQRFSTAGKKPANRIRSSPASRPYCAMLSASAARDYFVRTGGNVGLMVPIRSRPLSAKFAGLSLAGGKLGLGVPMRTLPLSSVAAPGMRATLSASIFFTGSLH